MSERAHKEGRQMSYLANSNLVLSANRGSRNKDSSVSDVVESLGKKLTAKELMKQFGDRVKSSDIIAERIAKSKRKREEKQMDETIENRKKSKVSNTNTSILDVNVDMTYRPSMKDTKAAYEVFLTLLSEYAEYTNREILQSAADDVISILRDETLTDKTKKDDIETMFRHKSINEDRFSKMLNVSKKLVDFEQDDDDNIQNVDEDIRVMFDDEEEKIGDSDIDEVVGDSDDDAEGEDTGITEHVEFKHNEMDMNDDEINDNSIDVRTIDAFWIQRQVSKYYNDPLISQKIAEEIYDNIKNINLTDRDCENKLVLLLDYDKFDFIKLLLTNRNEISYCTRLARADNNEKDIIINEMQSDPKLLHILELLSKTSTAKDRETDRERHLKKEAKELMEKTSSSSSNTMSDDIINKDDDLSKDAYWNKKPKINLDLSSLSFNQGGQFMSNKQVKLPPNADVISKKGYQEVHIAPVKSGLGQNEKLIPVDDIPNWAQNGFKGMKTFNRVQSKIYHAAFETPQNMLICAPTGAGKTNCAMLTIMRELGIYRNNDGTIDTDSFKIVYIAPMKSLVQEMVMNFSKRLQPYNVKVRELSGDVQLSQEQIADTQVIVTTPEKWDIVTRKSGDRTYTQLVKLLIIDEVHLLHDSRGPVLESIVARTIRQIEYTQDLTRIIGLSATLPNYEDVAIFLRVKEDSGLFVFDNSFRPVPLQQQYIGVNQKRAFKRHEMITELTYTKCHQQLKKGYQVLIFVHSRKDTFTTAKTLIDMAKEKDELSSFVDTDSGRKVLLTTESKNVTHEGLKELLPYGVAIHHAGMNRDDRTLVEELFSDNHISVLVSTATLAWGVNLPAHSVIIKGTQVYSPEKGTWTELSIMDVMQMFGRAGRPQFDKFGEGIIITTQKDLHYYLSLLNEQLPIESQYISKLPDNLNAEIVSGAVNNMKEAVNWLGYTYLFIRMLRAPHVYGITMDELESDPELEQRRIDLIHSAAIILDKSQLIKYDKKSGIFITTDLGRVSSHYYLGYESMNTFNEHLKSNMNDIDLFRVFSLSTEFKYMSVREEEKMELAKLLDKVPIPVKETVDDPAAKVNVLLQTYISKLHFDGFALIADMVYITQSGGRIVRALFEIALRRGWASLAVKCLNLSKMIDKRMWCAQSPLRQFKISQNIIKRLEGMDLPWDRYQDLEYHALGSLIKLPKMGKKIHKYIHQLPRLDLQGHVQPITRTLLRIDLTITPDFEWDDNIHGTSEPFWIIIEDVDSEISLHYEYFILRSQFSTQEHNLTFTVPIHDPLPPQYFIRVISDRWIGSETVLPISFRNLILPERFPACTELLDLRSLYIEELANERYIKYFQSKNINILNGIQTQVFKSIYKKNDNVFIGAPTGSGKTLLAELAIMKLFTIDHQQQHDTTSTNKCIYIAPYESLVKERYNDWKNAFQDILNINIVMLSGDIATDLKLMQSGQLILSTPENWDIMSRRWRTRKNVQQVSLFIVDELHLLGGQIGPILEVILSRMRYIASQMDKKIRIIGLSSCIANGIDVSEWLGVTKHNTYSFHPSTRSLPLEIIISGYDHISFTSRQLAMVKPAYKRITKQCNNRPVIVFTPNKKLVTETAMDFLSFSTSDASNNNSKETMCGFLKISITKLETFIERIENPLLRHTLCAGIGMYHEGMSSNDKNIISYLFNNEFIQVVLCQSSLCWGLPMSSYAVIIMGTQVYNSSEYGYVDIPLADILQMMGRACRPGKDENSRAFIMTQTTKKLFYRKFLLEPFPIESHLGSALTDHINAEVITKRIENIQDAMDYVTWTFMYRRLTRNPNYYNLQGITHQHVSDHLSEFIETIIDDLKEAQCINVDEDDMDISPLNLGMIASYYNMHYNTVELFSTFLTSKVKLSGLVELLSNATEFQTVPLHPKDENSLRVIARHLPLEIKESRGYSDSHVKANILLQSYLSRLPLSSTFISQQMKMIPDASRLLQAMIDVISSNGWLLPALACMELSQMITQCMWHTDNHLLQLPHFSLELANKCKNSGISTILDVADMEDDQRSKLLCDINPKQMGDIASFCNAYPDIEMNVSIPDSDNLETNKSVIVHVTLERDEDDDEVIPKTVAYRYPGEKSEGWWIVIGNVSTNELLSIKRVAMKKNSMTFKLEFTPKKAEIINLKCFLMSDSYIGVDQEETISLSIMQGAEMVDDSSSSGDEESD